MAFATSAELAVRLKRTFDTATAAQVDALLEDATAALVDDVLGGNMVVQGTTTAVFNVPEGERTIVLPQQPVRSVTTVLVDGVGVTGWAVRGGRLILPGPARAVELYDVVRPVLVDSVQVTVTWLHGVPTVPAELKSWCMVLGAQALAMLEGPTGSLTPGAVAATRIDDFSVSYAQGAAGGAAAAAPGLVVPDAVRERLGARWGVGAFVTPVAP